MRTRPVCVKVLGKEHELLSAFPCNLATDLLTLVEAFRRGKQVRLSSDRVAAVESALESLDSSLQAIRHSIEELKRGSSESFDANVYYDSNRAAAYTEEFGEVQARHTERCLYLLGPSTSSVVLDLGCGSGLSSARLQRSVGFVVGLDASEAMLATAAASVSTADFVLADFNQRLPFRRGAFDLGSSTSALHYVRSARLDAFLGDLLSRVKQKTAVQLFCRGGLSELTQNWLDKWSGSQALLFADRPHHKNDRFYLLLPSTGHVAVKRLACSAETKDGCGVFGASGCHCLLQVEGAWSEVAGDHATWLQNEHKRYVHRQERLSRRKRSEHEASI